MKNAGKITIPAGSYLGTGDAILFLRKNNQTICDKIAYIYEDSAPEEFESDEHHHPLKVMMSCWQAVLPSLKIYYDLIESNNG